MRRSRRHVYTIFLSAAWVAKSKCFPSPNQGVRRRRGAGEGFFPMPRICPDCHHYRDGYIMFHNPVTGGNTLGFACLGNDMTFTSCGIYI